MHHFPFFDFRRANGPSSIIIINGSERSMKHVRIATLQCFDHKPNRNLIMIGKLIFEIF